MKIKIFFYICLSICAYAYMSPIYAQARKNYDLGDGIIVFPYKPWLAKPKTTVVFYKDANCSAPLQTLMLENTNCPTCMECAEPTNYYKGALRPFICSASQGVVFICNKFTDAAYEIFIDTLGTIAYIPKPSTALYQTWKTYMTNRGQKGDFFSFDRGLNSTVIFDKKYDLNNLPTADKKFCVGVKINAIEAVKFYPVDVEGYWMKIKGVRNGKTVGYYWVIWRNKTDWLIGFTFNA